MIKRLSQLNTYPLFDLNGPPSQDREILLRSAPIGGQPSDEKLPKRQ